MRVIFMGTPDFAVPTLDALIGADHEIAAVYTQPPRAAGRGLSLRPSPVQRVAETRGLKVRTPVRLRDADDQAAFRALEADVAVVAAYGLILPAAILDGTAQGCLNIHPSLLPRWRGAAPIQRAILAGDRETGVMVMRMEQGLDTGPVCLTRKVAIRPDETAGELHDRLAREGATLMLRALGRMAGRPLDCRPQGETGVTYAAKIDNAEARIDWSRPARAVHDQIRGLSPFPGAWFGIGRAGCEERIKVLRSERATGSGAPGTLLDGRLTVACGEGAVRLVEVQPGGKRSMPAEAYLRGARLEPGTPLNSA